MALVRIEDLDLKPLPGTRLRALQMLPQAEVELAELVSLVETDPVLTMAMLRLANSASSAPGRRIGTARAAVIRVGSLTTRRAIAGSVLQGAFPAPDATAIDLDEYWRHALATALLADAAAARSGSRTEAFTAALLHDIGVLAMASSEPVRYERVKRLVRQGVSESDAERVMFGHDHAHYGMRIAERWELAPTIVAAIADHHHGAANETAAALVRGREIAGRAGIGDGRVLAPHEGGKFEPEDRAVMHAMRGPEGLNAQINSFRQAMGLAPAAEKPPGAAAASAGGAEGAEAAPPPRKGKFDQRPPKPQALVH